MSSDDAVITHALAILKRRIRQPIDKLSSASSVKEFLTVKLALEEREIFGALWLNAKNRVIACDELFLGTLTQTAIYPREVVKAALRHNAAAGIFFHNHPSGWAEPSRADKAITRELRQALALVDVRVYDHIIIAGTQSMSFAERGMM